MQLYQPRTGDSVPTSITPANADYIENIYSTWKRDPDAVPVSWAYFFQGFEMAIGSEGFVREEFAVAQSKVNHLIFSYRNIGHLLAAVDPLGTGTGVKADLSLPAFGLNETDLDRIFDTGFFAEKSERRPLREIVQILNDTYCRTIGVEYLHIHNVDEQRWLQERLEGTRSTPSYSREKKLQILQALTEAELFESFIHSRFPGQKRFSLEGGESIIPALRKLIERAGDLAVEEVVLGMAHRGRLNVLSNVLGKTYSTLLSEFEEKFIPGTVGGDDDVKYHRGFNNVYETPTHKRVALSLTANPSHLEAVNPAVEGRTRAKQRQYGDTAKRKKVVPVLIHGDAAFAGQGLVAETLNLSKLPGYSTGGTIHFIINNQIGFTTLPKESRSTQYCTDVAKMIEAPIFHVNGDDPEAVCFVTELAMEFRHEFGQDVVIDMWCYRKYGHNESDEPAFTQPVMYKKIKAHDPPRKIYVEKLVGENTIAADEAKAIEDRVAGRLQEAFESIRSRDNSTRMLIAATPPRHKWANYEQAWEGLLEPYTDEPAHTAVDRETMIAVARALTTVPPGFNINPKVERALPKKFAAVAEGIGEIDWPYAELLAFGSLLAEGTPVRLSGQDCERGTFSQRHSVWRDLETQAPYNPLNHIRSGQPTFCVYNSMLSEAAVLGFDYGYSLSEPRMLVLWEAQFGDFANGAQVIIDQFITSSLTKWQRTSGIVMLLPHGYEGQGPEHSNAYLERYLQASADNNIQVCHFTTPANYFHALRRQVRRPFRRPLIVMSPKSLLRHKLCVSPIADFTDGHFQEVIDDPTPPTNPERVLFCSGKVFYDLLERRSSGEAGQRAVIVRVEQMYPFPETQIKAALDKYATVEQVIWVQEEPANRGAWSFMFPRFLELLGPEKMPRYVGRRASASPATGSYKIHTREHDHLIRTALDG